MTSCGKQRIRKVAPDGTQSTVVTSPVLVRPVGVAADATGNLFVGDTGRVVEISPQGLVTTVANRGATGSIALDPAGNLFIPSGREVDRLGTDGSFSPVAATGEYNTTFAPGFSNLSPPIEIANASAVGIDKAGSLYVTDNGKSVIQRVSANCALSHADGKLPVSVGGVRLTVSGIPVPLISVSSGEILAATSDGIGGMIDPTWTLTYGGSTISRFVSVQAAQPGIFTQDGSGSGPAVVLNEGGVPNTQSNPAAKGALVAIYATGLGQTDPPETDGLMASSPLPQPQLTVKVSIGGQAAEVMDAGPAPGFVGLSVVDVRVAVGLTAQGALPLTISAGSYVGLQGTSPLGPSVTIWIAP